MVEKKMGKERKSVCECIYDRLRAWKRDKERERKRKTRQEDKGDF